VPERTVERETALPPPDGPDAVPEPTRVPTLIRETSPALQPPGPERTYLAVPYDEKDDARQLGARWDRTEKAWYVPAGVDLEAFTPWLPAKGSVHIAVDADPAEQFAEAIRACGLRLDGPARMDGQRHRLPVEGDQARERSGAYQGQLDGRPAGVIRNHKTGVRVNWTASGPAAALGARDRAQMAAQAAEKRHDRARGRERQAERTAQQVDALWTAATPARAHPYLADKGVQAHGLRQDADGRLMVPVQDADGRIRGLQRIGKDGVTRFEPSDRVEGGHYVIGDVTRPGPLLIAEGFATVAPADPGRCRSAAPHLDSPDTLYRRTRPCPTRPRRPTNLPPPRHRPGGRGRTALRPRLFPQARGLASCARFTWSWRPRVGSARPTSRR